MEGGASGEGSWIATERTHPLYLVQVLGSTPIFAVALIYLWFAVLVPQYGFEVAVLTVLLAAIGCAVIDLFTWTVFRPTAIRVSPAGIEIRRQFAAVFTIPSEKLVLTSRPPEGYGLASYTQRNGFILSPNQFAAAKRVFPVQDDAKPVPGPLP
jgi:hypothetical protein